MRSRVRAYLPWLVLLSCYGISQAQCHQDEVLAGEDEHFWYCSARADFPEAAARLVFALDGAAKRVNPKKAIDPRTQDKNCSAFFREAGKRLSAIGEEWTRRDLQANDIARIIVGDRDHWHKVQGNYDQVTQQVQDLANNGAVVVALQEALPNGHLAIASPMPLTIQLSKFSGHGPMVRDGNVHLSQGKKKPSGWGAVRASYAFAGYTLGDQSPAWYVWLPSAR